MLSGALVLPFAIWIGAAVIAYFMTGDAIFPYTFAVVPAVAAALYLYYYRRHHRDYLASAKLGRERMAFVQAAVAELDAVATPQPDPSKRELTETEIAATRYLFECARQPVGQFEGFTRIDNFQLAALRYQLNYLSYGLALLQCKYMPNFHGYLNEAQRYAIESLAVPEVCAYWKFESLWGNLTWNPDPIGTRDNIMLTGLSLPPLTTYAANTGDLRYERGGALRFRPFKGRDVAYPHDAQSFVKSILWNWSVATYYHYPCEPFWIFPICNAYALCGIIAYDRVNGTGHAAGVYDRFVRVLEEEFTTPDGGVHPALSSFTGISPYAEHGLMEFDNLVSMCQVVNAIHPGYAKRWYAFAREEYFDLGASGLTLKQRSWETARISATTGRTREWRLPPSHLGRGSMATTPSRRRPS